MQSATGRPAFNAAIGGADLALQSKPPIHFEGVTARFFPLKANMYRLRAFCDSYLNIASQIVQFRPALPYVYLMALDYGKMAAVVGNLGWVSQHEVGFAVPLEWYRRENDRWVFVDWATVCPFIFVDNELSLLSGRDVYGWPKVKVWLEPEVNPWMSNPVDSPRLLTLSTMAYRELYAGKRQEPEVILQIRQEPSPRFLQFPPDLTDWFNPFRSAARAFSGYANMLGQFMETFTSLPLMGYDRTLGSPAWLNLLRQGTRYLNPLSAPPPANQITLKQFRDAERAGHICYQAIVSSEMSIKRYNAGGMLGDLNLLAGDPTGGFEILVRRNLAQPIVESLGIEVAGDRDREDAGMARLRPIFPFWLDLDLEYGIGKTICWRTRNSSWYLGGETPVQTPAEPSTPNHAFNTALGPGAQDVTGPFGFPNATVRVLPLLANPARLKRLCDDYLNGPLQKQFYSVEPWGSYVYLVVTNFGEMSSKTNNIGWWAERELSFFVPVRLRDPDGKLLSVAMIPAFVFADSETAVISGREINGLPAIAAAIKSPSNTWMTDSGPSEAADRGLLTLETMLLPALHLGQEVHWGLLLDIRQADALPYNDDVRWHMVAEAWGQELLGDHRKRVEVKNNDREAFTNLQALALEVLANREPIDTVTLKQFPDVGDPGAACYQALVRGRRVIDHIYDIREIEERIHLRIRRYPNVPIVETLGLKVKWTDTTGDAAVDILQPIRPFWMRLALTEHLGENLCWRVGAQWLPDAPVSHYFADSEPKVGPELVDLMRQRLAAKVQEWRSSAKLLTREDAKASVEKIEPQTAIESILSKEWENWGNPRWYREVHGEPIHQKPDLCIRVDSAGGYDADRLFPPAQRTKPDELWYSAEFPDALAQLAAKLAPAAPGGSESLPPPTVRSDKPK